MALCRLAFQQCLALELRNKRTLQGLATHCVKHATTSDKVNKYSREPAAVLGNTSRNSPIAFAAIRMLKAGLTRLCVKSIGRDRFDAPRVPADSDLKNGRQDFLEDARRVRKCCRRYPRSFSNQFRCSADSEVRNIMT